MSGAVLILDDLEGYVIRYGDEYEETTIAETTEELVEFIRDYFDGLEEA